MTKLSLLVLVLLLPTALFAENWKKTFKKDNITVYADKASPGIIPFKAIGTLDYNIETVLSILKDYKKKQLWAPKLKSVKLHKEISNDEFVFSEYYKTPWPASDREFLLKGTIKEVGNKYYLDAASVNDSKLKDGGHVQADVTKLYIVLEKIAENKTKISFEFKGDMKGWMPVWLTNLIQRRWPYLFIKGLRKRAQSITPTSYASRGKLH